MAYVGEIISLAIFCGVFGMFLMAIYLTVRHFHRKWKWEDQVHQNALRKELMGEMGIDYEVDDKGFVKPKIVHKPRV